MLIVKLAARTGVCTRLVITLATTLKGNHARPNAPDCAAGLQARSSILHSCVGSALRQLALVKAGWVRQVAAATARMANAAMPLSLTARVMRELRACDRLERMSVTDRNGYRVTGSSSKWQWAWRCCKLDHALCNWWWGTVAEAAQVCVHVGTGVQVRHDTCDGASACKWL